MKKIAFITLSILMALSIASCGQQRGQKQQSVTVNKTQPDLITPNFNADSAYKYIEKQVEFVPRVLNTA